MITIFVRKFVTLFLLSGVLLVTSFAASSQDVAKLSGEIKSDNSAQSVSKALVSLFDLDGTKIAETNSNENGYYQFEELEPGRVTVRITASGFGEIRDPFVRLFAGKTTIVDAVLVPVSDGAVEELIVTARAIQLSDPLAINASVFSREEIRRAPGTAGDIFRGLSTALGVTSTGEFSNFSVRGRGPRDNLIIIDGLPYDRAVHFDQSLGEEEDIAGGGRFSIFGQNVVDSAVFQPGGWSAQYGGANGSLLKLNLASGNRESAFRSVKTDLAGGEFLYDGPLGVGENGSLMVSVRRYDFGQLFDLIDEKDIGSPVLTDVLLKAGMDVGSGDRFEFLALYTPEKYTRSVENALASPDFEDMTLIDNSQDAALLGLIYKKQLENGGRWSNRIYARLADDETKQGEAYPELSTLNSDGTYNAADVFVDEDIIHLKESEKELGWRSDYILENALGAFSAGLHAQFISVDYETTLSRQYNVYVFDQNDQKLGEDAAFLTLLPAQYNAKLDKNVMRTAFYADQTYALDDWTLRAGLRGEFDGLDDYFTLSPRFSARYEVSSFTHLNISFGRYYQAPKLLDVATNASNIGLKHERSDQISLGIDHIMGEYVFRAEDYYQNLENLILDGDRASGAFDNNANGWSAGIDTVISKQFSDGWSAAVRYSYLKTRRKPDDGLPARPAEFERPHLFNATVNYEWNDRWSLGVQYQIASGKPGDYARINPNVAFDGGSWRSSREILERGTERLPYFQTLNVRFDYRRVIGGVSMVAFMDVVNVLGRNNVSTTEFSSRTGLTTREGLDTFPQAGLTIEF